MKTLIILAVIVSTIASTQVKAAAIAASYLSTTLAYGVFASSEKSGINSGAKQILVDAQDYLQTGDMTLALAQTVRDVQSVNPDMSESEVVDVVMTEAQDMLGM